MKFDLLDTGDPWTDNRTVKRPDQANHSVWSDHGTISPNGTPWKGTSDDLEVNGVDVTPSKTLFVTAMSDAKKDAMVV